ncbi:glycosyltransferase family 4 protein [Alphaproteobacteria bacterium]|nr:glycosyltransferase family 4 protein [Alphaproteobacteria bacterium]
MINKKIVLSSNSGWNLYNFRLGLIKSFLNNNFQVILITPKDQYTKKLEELGCKCYEISIDRKGTSIIKDLSILFRYLKLLKIIKPNFYLSFTAKPNIYGSIIANILKVKIINNVSGLGTGFIKKNWITFLLIILYYFSFRGSERIFFQNETDLNYFLKLKIVKRNNADILPGSGVDFNKFNYSLDECNEEVKTFLFFGRMLFDKGIRELVDAATEIKQDYPLIKFIFIGDIDKFNKTAITKNEIDDWVKKEIIEYHGFQHDVRLFIKKCDCVIIPSYREGMSKSLIESAAMGRPIITTDVPGCRELVVPGKNGFLCKPFSSRDIKKNIIKFIRLNKYERQKFCINSYNLVKKKFDEKIIIDKYLDAVLNK